MRICTAFLLAVVVLAACSSEDKASPTTAAPARSTVAGTDAQPPAPTVAFSDTTAGLEQLIRELGTADTPAPRASDLLASLELPTADAWFQTHFGPDAAAVLVKEYREVVPHLPELGEFIREMFAAERTRLLVERFDGPDDTAAVGYQKITLAVAKAPLALYSVRLRGQRDDDVFHLWSFVHDGTTFRWIGKLSVLATGDQTAVEAGGVDAMEFRVRDAARAKRLVQ